jgi:hypothetical protein
MIAVVWALAPATAHAATANYVAFYGDSSDFISQGQARLFTPASVHMHLEANGGGEVTAYVNDQANSESWNFTVSAPRGQSLTPGLYDNATRSPFREGSHPGLDVSGDGRGCNTLEGRFEVKDIAFKPDGQPERLWVVFEQHCDRTNAAAFGEVRMGVPVPDAAPVIAPSVVRWPSGNCPAG